ncbi:RloB domain-containing protein [Campylobacter hyointestinalis]|uniref:RloB domain-containing protein n=1 Tax=Campylobacter hyointestinalis TaxID=198 RepID=A0A562XKG2_CAMHY|nr:RloB domain-containing protein [Campylobacter hyointestinalis]TWO22639.1 RloB domain-containing protein [Campylobacter hyointestinalis]
MSKIKPRIRIEVIVEGMTEENYLKEFIKDRDRFDETLRFNFHNVKGGSYHSITKRIRSFKGLSEVTIFIVTDMDRLANDENELNSFKIMLKELNGFRYSFAFITYPNFEGFLSSHFDPYENNILNRLNLSKGELKSKKDIYNHILRNGGNFNNIFKRYRKENLCCYKRENKTIFDKSKIRLEQSSFIYFIEYCDDLKNKK